MVAQETPELVGMEESGLDVVDVDPPVPFLPLPLVVKEGERYRLVTERKERPQTIGKLFVEAISQRDAPSFASGE